MLALLFHIGPQRHAIDSRFVERVVPLVTAQQVPDAPPWLVGAARMLGVATPVVDVSHMLVGTAARRLLSTRLLLIQYASGGISRPLALMVENMTDSVTLTSPEPAPKNEPVHVTHVVFDPRGPIRLIDPQKLLPDFALAMLFDACDSLSPATPSERR